MSDFSDREDRMLIQHAVLEISWREIATKMKTRKTPEQLRLRVACLKKRFGNVLSNFPRWYFLKLANSTCRKSLQRPNLPQPQRRRENVRSAATDVGRFAAVGKVVKQVNQMKCSNVPI
jgi:hypothetical protein